VAKSGGAARWGSERAAAFISSFEQRVTDGIVLNRDTAAFSITAFDAGELNVNSVLDAIASVRGRIMYAAITPRMMRAIFAEFDTRVRSSTDTWFQSFGDFAWMIGWVSEQIIRNEVRSKYTLSGWPFSTF
jgi:hypothetical protein